MKPPPTHYRHRFPAEIIGHAVWLYHVFSLSLRDVELLLAERGIVVSDQTVRRWCKQFGRTFASCLRRRRPRAGGEPISKGPVWPLWATVLDIELATATSPRCTLSRSLQSCTRAATVSACPSSGMLAASVCAAPSIRTPRTRYGSASLAAIRQIASRKDKRRVGLLLGDTLNVMDQCFDGEEWAVRHGACMAGRMAEAQGADARSVVSDPKLTVAPGGLWCNLPAALSSRPSGELRAV